ncbi:unnamed protein product [Rotaria socialis]|uniref:Uncharacterized protein n=1 Tax=Rotaria socialis TaxID=392032 RepID=A0A818AJY9_9BILA|nr:unnamed protein product [Rotaria socialis]CAF3406889.1 unnamed protein product [Rotaria socialis]CAF4567373.1 unnamed protein product [Rotaria socialis]
MTFSSNLFLPIRLFVLVVGSNWVRVQHRYSIGGKFTYAENKATTTVNLLTGKTNITFQETICTERMVEVEDELRGTSGEVEKSCTRARFIPPDKLAKTCILFSRTLDELKMLTNKSIDYSVGDNWSNKIMESTFIHATVTRLIG